MGVLRDRMVREMSLREFSASTQKSYLATLTDLAKYHSMSAGGSAARHCSALGETCGRMIAAIRPPVLNAIDAIWVSHKALGECPASATHRANQLLASQQPVALD